MGQPPEVALRQRINDLLARNTAEVERPGKGRAASYTAESIYDLIWALKNQELGLSPVRASALIKNARKSGWLDRLRMEERASGADIWALHYSEGFSDGTTVPKTVEVLDTLDKIHAALKEVENAGRGARVFCLSLVNLSALVRDADSLIRRHSPLRPQCRAA